MPPQRVWFLRRFGLITGIYFAHFGLKSGMVFEGTTVIQMNKKESVICQFEIDWNLSFVVPNLSNDDIISVYANIYGAFCDHLHVWKQAWILEARSENGCSNRVRILRTGRHIPTKNSEEYPRAHYTLYWEKNEHGQFLNCLTSRWCFTKRGNEKFGRSFKWS